MQETLVQSTLDKLVLSCLPSIALLGAPWGLLVMGGAGCRQEWGIVQEGPLMGERMTDGLNSSRNLHNKACNNILLRKQASGYKSF